MAGQTQDRLKNLFFDLGKATKRGVRKCPVCGMKNGTRGLACKNKECEHVFKESQARKKGAQQGLDAVRITTGTTVQVFSVRIRERGPEVRGFVQLPVIQTSDGSPVDMTDPTLLFPILITHGKCFVESCQGNMQRQANGCQHIRSAIEAHSVSRPLDIGEEHINQLNMPASIRQAILREANRSDIPLVQRVSRDLMIVKCDADDQQPLGFLHVAFPRNGQKYYCPCKADCKFSTKRRVCIHFLICMCAFLTNQDLETEFARFFPIMEPYRMIEGLPIPLGDPPTLVVDQTYSMELPDDPPIPVEPPVTDLPEPMEPLDEYDATYAGDFNSVEVVIDNMENMVQAEPDINSTLTFASVTPQPEVEKIRRGRGMNNKTIDECTCHLFFLDWLSSITERINHTMHFQFPGSPKPLVFTAPQVFFECLQNRISAGSKRRRLPNIMATVERRDCAPIGTFTKYTWHLTTILQVKQVFDTDQVQLQVTRSFVDNKDGTYDVLDDNRRLHEPFSNDGKNLPIRPFELKTFLKVGATNEDDHTITPFIIEWIADVLPKTNMGELHLKFEFGHQRNGKVEIRQVNHM